MTTFALVVSRALALVVPLLAMLVALGLGFAIMTGCTTDYSCGPGACEPCRATESWLVAGWVAQGLLLLVAIGLLALPSARRLRPAVAVGLALAVPVASIGALAVTSWAAESSYCQPGDGWSDGREDYCDVD